LSKVLRASVPFRTIEGLVAIALALCGLAATLALFYPGIATHDALAVYDQAYAWSFGDWQPPLLGVIWIGLERLFGYGPAAMLVPTLSAFWLAILLGFVALRRTGALSAWGIFLVPLMPPVFAILGIIWRDVIFAVLWLLAFALATLTSAQGRRTRWGLTALALMALMIGYWVRPNALFAAVPMVIYVLRPGDWSFVRPIVWGLPIMLVLQGSTYLVNTTWLQAREEHVGHSILVFDLSGTSHFSGQNVFPVTRWTPDQVAKVISTCYRSNYWDSIWWKGCTFAMAAIDRDDPPGTKLFGSQRLVDAWIQAIRTHPLAYLRHRLAFFEALMTWENMVVFDQARSGQYRFWLIKSTAYSYFENAMLWLNANTPLFRGLTWLVLGLATGLAGLRVPNGRGKAAVLTLASSGVIYTLTYMLFGVAAEYRYVYWTALSSLVAAVVLAVKIEIARRGKTVLVAPAGHETTRRASLAMPAAL
jgi:hypothetical protein